MGAGLFLAWVPCIDIIKGVFSQWTYLPEVAQAYGVSITPLPSMVMMNLWLASGGPVG